MKVACLNSVPIEVSVSKKRNSFLLGLDMLSRQRKPFYVFEGNQRLSMHVSLSEAQTCARKHRFD